MYFGKGWWKVAAPMHHPVVNINIFSGISKKLYLRKGSVRLSAVRKKDSVSVYTSERYRHVKKRIMLFQNGGNK